MSVTDNTYDGPVGRWQPDSQGRLQEAALALYADRGFEQTTAAEIAARAGVTERTFYRHFSDKREVLFGGAAILKERIVVGVTSAPPGEGALDAVGRGLAVAAEMLGAGRRDLSRLRQAVISGNPELHERELAKLADFATAVAETLHQRGVSEPQATLAADAGMTVLRVALDRWANASEDLVLGDLMRDALAELRAVAAG